MAENSKISWTDHTANYWWGCFKVSDGCKNCYASTLSHRYGKSIWGPAATTNRECKKAVWANVPKWNKQAAKDGVRRRVFVQSMADFFEDHPQVVQWRRDALHLMSQCRSLDFQILTKRPGNINRMIESGTGRSAEAWCADNHHCWFGTSVENQEQADRRIPELLKVPARIHFLSCEPLLGPIDFREVPDFNRYNLSLYGWWVIAGAESGHGARPMQLDWVRSLRDQCVVASVPFFFKQKIDGGKKVELPELDGKVWAEMPRGVVTA